MSHAGEVECLKKLNNEGSTSSRSLMAITSGVSNSFESATKSWCDFEIDLIQLEKRPVTSFEKLQRMGLGVEIERLEGIEEQRSIPSISDDN